MSLGMGAVLSGGAKQALLNAKIGTLNMPAVPRSVEKLAGELPQYAQQFELGTKGQYLMESLVGASGNAKTVIQNQLDAVVFRSQLNSVAPMATGAAMLHMALDATLFRRDSKVDI